MTRRGLVASSAWLPVLAGLSGCTSTTTSVATANGPPTYSIECIELSECWVAAQRACRGPYETVLTRHNEIPESELPGLNAVTQSHTSRPYRAGGRGVGEVPPGGPGIESDAPMPLAEVVVVCSTTG